MASASHYVGTRKWRVESGSYLLLVGLLDFAFIIRWQYNDALVYGQWLRASNYGRQQDDWKKGEKKQKVSLHLSALRIPTCLYFHCILKTSSQ